MIKATVVAFVLCYVFFFWCLYQCWTPSAYLASGFIEIVYKLESMDDNHSIVRISLLFAPILSILILSIWRVPRILYFCWTMLFYFLLNYCILNLGWSVHLFWSVKNLFIDECYIFVELYYFEYGLKIWSICTVFWNVKKIISRWMLYLILCRLKWVVLHSCQPNTTRLLSVPNGLGQVNPPY